MNRIYINQRRTIRAMKSERGSVILLVALALAVVTGMVGLAMDVGQMYVTKQKARGAADAAALAGVMDLYNQTDFATHSFIDDPHKIECQTSQAAPCKYALLNGFGNSVHAGDQVTLDFGPRNG